MAEWTCWWGSVAGAIGSQWSETGAVRCPDPSELSEVDPTRVGSVGYRVRWHCGRDDRLVVGRIGLERRHAGGVAWRRRLPSPP
jgi:hypothetical protein